MNDDVYNLHGYEDREDYLAALAEDYDTSAVYALAELLGPAEDFDGLVTALEDLT